MATESFNSDKRFAEEIDPIKKAIGWACYLGIAIVAIASMNEEVRKLLEEPYDIMRFLHVALFGTVIALGGVWIQSGMYELDMTARWLSTEKYLPPTNSIIIGTIAAIGVLIGALAVVTKWIDRYIVLYLLYLVVDLIWWRFRRKEYKVAIARSRDIRPSEMQLRGIAELELYYLRPHYLRCWILVACTIALGILVLIPNSLDPLTRQQIGYIGSICIIIGSEIPIQIWRYKRDECLREIRSSARHLQ